MQPSRRSAAKLAKLAFLWCARAVGLFALGRRITRRGIIVIAWHGVSLENEHERFPTLFISPDTLRRRLTFLTKHFRVVSLDQAQRSLDSGAVAPGQVVLTFDDGYYNFYGKAIDILGEFNAVATVYVVTKGLEDEEPTHNMLARDIIASTRAQTIVWSAHGIPVSGAATLTDRKGRQRATSDLVGVVDRCETPDGKIDMLRRAGAALNVDVDARLRTRIWHRMNPVEIRALRARGHSAQLHTHTHVNVIDGAARLREELALNQTVLKNITGETPVHFCYPSGLWNRSAWPILREMGVQTATTTRQGPNFPSTPRLALRRYLNGEHTHQLEFEFQMSGLQWLLGVIRDRKRWTTPSEKNRRYREDGALL